jgi:hypothetical protein
MVRRIVVTTVGLLCFAIVGLMAAANVTFVLNNGERHSGEFVVRYGDNTLALRQNGQERVFPISQIAAFIYNGGDPSANELSQLPSSDNPPELERHMLVLQDGRVIRGKVYKWDPDTVTFDSTSGRATYHANDIARLYMSGPPARNAFAASSSSQRTVDNNGRRGRGWGRGRQGENSQPQAMISVQANQPWTDTGLLVRRGELIAFSTNGTIEFGRNMSAGPDGNRDLPPNVRYPVRNMPVGGLIGRVGNSAPFAIGSSTSPIPMPADGRLFIGVNDDGYQDNTGAFEVSINRR